MTKKEVIWREILFQASKNKKTHFTQKALAQKYQVSLSTVFNALKAPRQSGIVRVGGKGFEVIDIEKFLNLWATQRNLKKDTIYKTQVSKDVQEIEKEMPPEVIFGAFSAYTQKYEDTPADYDRVYIYSFKKDLPEIKKRFPKKKGYSNLTVLEADPWLKNFGLVTPDPQTFVDLWNLSEWYAKDYLKALKDKILS